MKFRRIETPGLVHYAYVFGDKGVGAVVDPRRDIDEYLDAARELGLRIDFVIETHRQEDFVMGSAELAARTGAKIVNAQHELLTHGDLRLRDGETFTMGGAMGGLSIRALATPGHTPESMAYVVYLDARDAQTGRAYAVFTGDALLFGDTGRTDLPADRIFADSADGIDRGEGRPDPKQVEHYAGQLHDTLAQKFAPLPDETLVLPAHGPGSVCGSGLADRPWSTIGLERRTNPGFTLDRAAFVARRVGEHLPRPPYFRHMEVVNQSGGLAPVRSRGEVPLFDPEAFAERRADTILIDTREPEAFAGGHIPGAYSIWLDGLASFAGWVASHDSPILLCTDTNADVDIATARLARLGLDELRGALRGGFGTWRASGRAIETTGVMLPDELAEQLDQVAVLDVRDDDEFASGHIEHAHHVFVGHIEQLESLDLDRDRPLVVTCGVGHRGSLGVSVLARAGFTDVRNLLGGMKAWRALELPTVTGDRGDQGRQSTREEPPRRTSHPSNLATSTGSSTR